MLLPCAKYQADMHRYLNMQFLWQGLSVSSHSPVPIPEFKSNFAIPVLYNGLGTHITQVPPDQLTVYLKVSYQDIITCYVIGMRILTDFRLSHQGLSFTLPVLPA